MCMFRLDVAIATNQPHVVGPTKDRTIPGSSRFSRKSLLVFSLIDLSLPKQAIFCPDCTYANYRWTIRCEKRAPKQTYSNWSAFGLNFFEFWKIFLSLSPFLSLIFRSILIWITLSRYSMRCFGFSSIWRYRVIELLCRALRHVSAFHQRAVPLLLSKLLTASLHSVLLMLSFGLLFTNHLVMRSSYSSFLPFNAGWMIAKWGHTIKWPGIRMTAITLQYVELSALYYTIVMEANKFASGSF